MAAMTLRGLDDLTASRLKSEARKRGVSVNALLKQLVRQGLGLERGRGPYTDLDALAGTWTEEEAVEFARATDSFERVEPEAWR